MHLSQIKIKISTLFKCSNCALTFFVKMYANYPKQNKGINMLFLMIERKKGQVLEVKKITYLLEYYEVLTNQKKYLYKFQGEFNFSM